MTTSTPRGTISGKADRKPTRKPARKLRTHRKPTGLLVQYREEYQTRFLAAARGGLSPGEWQNYTGFLGKLDEAISQAASAMSHTRQRTVAGQQEWLAKRGRVKAFDTLSDRHQSRLAYQDQRHEQKISDEHAARRHGEKEKD